MTPTSPRSECAAATVPPCRMGDGDRCWGGDRCTPWRRWSLARCAGGVRMPSPNLAAAPPSCGSGSNPRPRRTAVDGLVNSTGCAVAVGTNAGAGDGTACGAWCRWPAWAAADAAAKGSRLAVPVSTPRLAAALRARDRMPAGPPTTGYAARLVLALLPVPVLVAAPPPYDGMPPVVGGPFTAVGAVAPVWVLPEGAATAAEENGGITPAAAAGVVNAGADSDVVMVGMAYEVEALNLCVHSRTSRHPHCLTAEQPQPQPQPRRHRHAQPASTYGSYRPMPPPVPAAPTPPTFEPSP